MDHLLKNITPTPGFPPWKRLYTLPCFYSALPVMITSKKDLSQKCKKAYLLLAGDPKKESFL